MAVVSAVLTFPLLASEGNLFEEVADASFAEAVRAREIAIGSADSEEEEEIVVDDEPERDSDEEAMFGSEDSPTAESVQVDDGFQCPYVVTSTSLNVFLKVTGAYLSTRRPCCGVVMHGLA